MIFSTDENQHNMLTMFVEQRKTQTLVVALFLLTQKNRQRHTHCFPVANVSSRPPQALHLRGFCWHESDSHRHSKKKGEFNWGFHTDMMRRHFLRDGRNRVDHFLCSPLGVMLNLRPVRQDFDASVKKDLPVWKPQIKNTRTFSAVLPIVRTETQTPLSQ